MELKSPFFLRKVATESVIKLLESTTLGTNGAKYKHLNTRELINELDDPLFLSIERGDKAIANITFCKREENYYIRYFAFSNVFQSNKKKNSTNNFSKFKLNIANYLDKLIHNDGFLYAYIDPNNDKSRWMSENFGFQKIAQLRTQTFSRLQPKIDSNFQQIVDQNEINKEISRFQNELFFTPNNSKRTKSFKLCDEMGTTIAFARTQQANWKIEQLPGKFGKQKVKILPFLPLINKLIIPEKHDFIVVDCVFVKENNPIYLQKLFESILAAYVQKLIFWWTDENHSYFNAKHKTSWGILDKIIGRPKVNVVVKCREMNVTSELRKKAVFVSGTDLI